MTIRTPDAPRICRHTSLPSLPGSMRSSRTRSGWVARNTPSASSPSSQNTGSKPSDRSTMPIISASAVSSSTTSTRPFMRAFSHHAARPVASLGGRRVRHAARHAQITRSRVPRTGRRGTMIPPRGPATTLPRDSTPSRGSSARMTSPHDDVPQDPTWASPTGPGPTAPPPGPTQPPPYGQQPPPGYPQPPAYGQQPPPGWGAPPPGAPGWGQPTAPPGAAWRPPSLQPGIIPLRPIGLGEIYDGAFRAIRANPKVMFGLAAIVVTVAVALQSLVSWYVQGLLAPTIADLARQADPDGLFGFEESWGSLSGALAGVPITSLATTVLTGLLIISVSRSVLGQVVSVRDVVRSGRVWLVVAFSLMVTVLTVVVGALAAGVVVLAALSGSVGLVVLAALVAIGAYVVFAFWLTVRTLLAAPALMLEGKSFLPTIGRAWRLTRRSFWRLLGIWLLTAILASVISAVFTFPAQ